jgi:putative transposase
MYRWFSYRVNTQGVECELITPHGLYRALGRTDHERRLAYSGLFQTAIDCRELDRIRSATQSGEIIGNQRFRDQIAHALRRRVDKMSHGGDRKSESFRKRRNSSDLTP